MKRAFTRRDFLKLGLLGLGGLAFRPYFHPSDQPNSSEVARVTIESISVYKEPWDESEVMFQLYRDQLVHLYYAVVSDHGPEYNPLWYRVWGGYIHSARLQHVITQYNPVAYSIPEHGQLGEITVPFSDSMQNIGGGRWQTLYRLYYQSVHWINDIVEGPDGTAWYQIKEAWSNLMYDVPASHVRLIPPEELTPLSPDVPPHKKRIEVSISKQTLTAYEDDQPVMQTKISSGLNRKPQGETPWKTPSGTWHIFSKMPSKHMGNGDLTYDIDAYELPGVPWVCFFHTTGVATHGTYWHTNYGTPMSHGCVNMPSADARWIFRWTTPVVDYTMKEIRGFGTKVIVG